MKPTDWSIALAGLATVMWILKGAAVGLAAADAVVKPLYWLGVAAYFGAWMTLGLERRSGWWGRLISVLGGAVLAVVMFNVTFAAVGAFRDPADRHWIWTQIGLWIAAALILGMALLLRRRLQHEE